MLEISGGGSGAQAEDPNADGVGGLPIKLDIMYQHITTQQIVQFRMNKIRCACDVDTRRSRHVQQS
jgi:hypothetical protein